MMPLRALRKISLLRRRRRRLSIAAVLVGGFGGLVLLAVAAVLALGIGSAGRNTFSLLDDNADLVLSNVELRLRQRLEAAERAAAHVAALAEQGGFADASAAAQQQEQLRAVLALSPDVTGVAWFGRDKTDVRISRQRGVLDADATELHGLPQGALKELLAQADGRTAPVWGAPSWSKALHTSLVGVVKAAFRDGRVIGYAGVGVSLGDLSRFLMQLYADQGVNAFVLYDRQHVLAHPTLAAREIDLSARADGPPLPRIDEVDDLALAALWRGESVGNPGHGIEQRRVQVAGEAYFFLLRPMGGGGPQNWTVGVWFPEREANREIRRLVTAATAGLVILLVSVAVAFYVGRRISQSIGQFAEAAERVRSLDFSETRPIPGSRLAEIDRAAAAFNAMLAGLRWFETYVPKGLVLRLMKRGLAETSLRSEERVVTVMFTDIRGFSDMAQSLSPVDTQALLTRHFSLLAACIEAEDGTVDKFIGDAVMAFWGAPDDQPDHAARALRAAAAIAEAVAQDNRDAPAGALPVHVRVALHSGPVVVGNIGSAARVNYTIIGDTVNVAARLEELARSLHAVDAPTCVLVTEATVRLAAGDEPSPSLTPLGPRRLRGRAEAVRVWKLAQ